MNLTKREREVCALMADGLNNREIGEAIGLSPRTVEIHRGTAIKKLGAKNGTHAAVLFDRSNRNG